MNKQVLRKKFGAIRRTIENREQKDFAIFEKLQELSRAYPKIFCYVSFGSEVDTHRFITENADKIYIPFTKDGTMKCRKYLGGDLSADKLGNLSPACYGEEGDPMLTVVPMLAFDNSCFRLGYGGGYYDKFLVNAFTVKIGLAYDEQFTEEVFNEIFDVPLDMILTPNKIYKR